MGKNSFRHPTEERESIHVSSPAGKIDKGSESSQLSDLEHREAQSNLRCERVVDRNDFTGMSSEETLIEVVEFGQCDLPSGYFDLCGTTEIIVEKVDPVEEFLEHLKKAVNYDSRGTKSGQDID